MTPVLKKCDLYMFDLMADNQQRCVLGKNTYLAMFITGETFRMFSIRTKIVLSDGYVKMRLVAGILPPIPQSHVTSLDVKISRSDIRLNPSSGHPDICMNIEYFVTHKPWMKAEIA